MILLEGAGERGLCAGGDIRALYESSQGQGRSRQDPVARGVHPQRPHRQISKTLCRLHGRHRDGRRRRAVRTQQPSRRHRRTKLAMPEVGLGFFPDVGGTWLLSRSPGEIGTYFGLTGQTMNGPDAVYAGFADAVVPSAQAAALREALTKLRARCDRGGSQKPDRWLCDRRDLGTGRGDAAADRRAGSPMTGCRISSRRCSAMARSWRRRR